MKDIDLNTTVEQVLRKYPFTRRFFESKKKCTVMFVPANHMKDCRLQP